MYIYINVIVTNNITRAKIKYIYTYTFKYIEHNHTHLCVLDI